MAEGERVFLLLETLERESLISQLGVEEALGCAVALASENAYFSVYRGTCGDECPFSMVEVRIPKPTASVRDGIVICTLAESGEPVMPEEVFARYGADPPMTVPPPEQRNAPVYFDYRRDGRRLSFGFAEAGRGRLVKIVLDATQKAREDEAQ